MKGIRASVGARTAAVILLCVLVIVCIVCAMGAWAVAYTDGYTLSSGEFLARLDESESPFSWVSPEDTPLLMGKLYSARWWLAAGTLGSFFAGIGVFIFLMCAAGCHRDSEKPRCSWLDKIPFEIVTAAVLACICLLGIAFGGLQVDRTPYDAALAIGLLLLIGLVMLLWFSTMAVRIKTGTFLKSCPAVRAVLWCVRGFWRIGMLGRTGLAVGGLLVFEVLLAAWFEDFGPVWFLEKLVLVPLLVYVLLAFRHVFDGTKEIAAGNEKYVIKTDRLRGSLKEHAEDLNNIRAGLSRAVDERMKSEHFQTELITNVSHDIKTPLTSIINYVDLMDREETDNEKLKEYIEVLKRQSGKLKKLIEDLIEASRASSGTIRAELKQCSLDVLMEQVIGEYSEKLAAAGLECVYTRPETGVDILADGRHMWRVLDNLLSNICKYSQRGTRVYIDLTCGTEKASIILRNTSAERLNLDEEELLRRFVRGDSSRHTEGSGLGLNIADNLTRLQGGTMRVVTDGDLFKVLLTFDRYFGE